jgi:hypothetical protein
MISFIKKSIKIKPNPHINHQKCLKSKIALVPISFYANGIFRSFYDFIP